MSPLSLWGLRARLRAGQHWGSVREGQWLKRNKPWQPKTAPTQLGHTLAWRPVMYTEWMAECVKEWIWPLMYTEWMGECVYGWIWLLIYCMKGCLCEWMKMGIDIGNSMKGWVCEGVNMGIDILCEWVNITVIDIQYKGLRVCEWVNIICNVYQYCVSNLA